MTDLNRAMTSKANSNAAPYWAPTANKPAQAPLVQPAASDAAPGPYIPPALRGRPQVARPAGVVGQFLSNNPATIIGGTPVVPMSAIPAPAAELPWIDTFLEGAETGATAKAENSVADAPSVESIDSVAETFASIEAAVPEAIDDGQPTSQAAADEVWPLEDAGQEMTDLANEIAPSVDASANVSDIDASNSHDTSDAQPLPLSQAAPLPMWNDEEWMDIMPMSPPIHASTEPEVRERPWADVAREVAARRSEVESAAAALESLAQRVRSGELPLPGYQPGSGDAAALASALAALLGVRR